MQVTLSVLSLNMDIATAISIPRFYNQLVPLLTFVDFGYSDQIIKGLRQKDHIVNVSAPGLIKAAIQGIMVSPTENKLWAASDGRKNGIAFAY